MIKRATSSEKGSFLYRDRLEQPAVGPGKSQADLYLAALARPPGRDELRRSATNCSRRARATWPSRCKISGGRCSIATSLSSITSSECLLASLASGRCDE